jgi:hippurate hydrolase
MDALPIAETTGKDYASETPGVMHACGHDGHTAMLLGAARYLAETRNFDGTAVVIFQPAEEGGAGGKAMIDDGMMERFKIDEVYGMHNLPGLPVGSFGIRPGALLASTDEFVVEVIGRGSHAAQPHRGADPLVAAAAMVGALQTIASRSVDPLESAVVSVTRIRIGDTTNVIAEKGEFGGTVRTLSAEVREQVEKRFREIVAGIAAAHGVEAKVRYRRNYPVTRNHPRQTEFAAAVAAEISGADRVDTGMAPLMGGEDFSYMLEARPGAFIFVGNGDTAALHNPAYDFNDEAIPTGASFWARLVERALPAG